MTSKEIEVVDLTNQQYEALVKMQMKAYSKVLDFCKENIADQGIIKTIDKNILDIDKKILTKLEDIKSDNKKFIEHLSEN